jgi:hypothetical protein
MFCRKCGKSIPDDSVFCPYCGEAITTAEPEEEETEDSEANEAPYGRCERCGNPLQADDGTLCEDCAAKMLHAYSDPPEQTYFDRDELTEKPVNHGGKGPMITAIVFVVVFFLIIGALVINGYVTTATAGSPTSSANSSSEISSAAESSSEEPEQSAAALTSSEPSSTESEKPALEILSVECNVDEYSTHVIGKLKNNTSKQLTYVQVQYALYDESGNQIGTALANVNGLDAGGTWKFDAIGITGETSKYKLIDLTGY